jgi:hypothetical protein
MDCYTTYDANGNPIHNYVGDVTVDLTSASNGGAGFVAPSFNDAPPGTPIVVQDTLPAYTMHPTVSGQSSPVSAPEPGALASLAIGGVALGMNRAYQRAIR